MGFIGLVKRAEALVKSFVNCHTLNVNCNAVNHITFVTGQPQRRGLRPIVKAIRSVKGVSCVH